jgi:hypothetical protein
MRAAPALPSLRAFVRMCLSAFPNPPLAPIDSVCRALYHGGLQECVDEAEDGPTKNQ